KKTTGNSSPFAECRVMSVIASSCSSSSSTLSISAIKAKSVKKDTNVLSSSAVFSKSCVTVKNSEIFSRRDRKSTRLNSSHVSISYAVFCLKKNKSIGTGRRQNKTKKMILKRILLSILVFVIKNGDGVEVVDSYEGIDARVVFAE